MIWPGFEKQPENHQVGDRIIFVNQFHENLSFGSLGTIVGIYDKQIEIILDEP